MNLPFDEILLDENQTCQVASQFASILKEGDLVCLNGNLGSGKTFFIKCVCNSFNISTASSPTFAIVNEYAGIKKITHIDFYRVKNVEELYDIGLEDYLMSSSICFIEWAAMFPEILPKKYYEITIEIIEETKRKIKIEMHE